MEALRESERASPFLKWAGGKRWLAARLAEMYRETPGRLVEPFVGGGALFFEVAPEEAVLADVNRELIRTYRAIQVNVEAVIEKLLPLTVSRDTFLQMREARPRSMFDVAARMIYLNRTAFNGLYRVNRLGDFNVPFGCKDGTVILDADGLRRAAKCLQAAQVVAQDFTDTLSGCAPGDFVYIDPPYVTRHNDNGFIRYNRALFSWADQEKLAREAVRLAQSGARVVVSNADHPAVRQLYPASMFRRTRVARWSRMAANRDHRAATTELLMFSRN